MHAPDGAFTEFSTGAEHTCVLRKSGETVCWGSNEDGQSSAPPDQFGR